MKNNPEKLPVSKTGSGKELIAACGLYCGACGIYIATKEDDHEKILQYALVLNQTFEETLCDGCDAERKSLHCTKMCTFIECKQTKKVVQCADCNDFPCEALLEFKSKMPHRIEIIDSLKRINEIGSENWLREMEAHYSCKKCNTVNSVYHTSCRKCGYSPGCGFVGKHINAIEGYLSK